MRNYSFVPTCSREIDKKFLVDYCNDDPDEVHKMLTVNELTGNPEDILLRCVTNPEQFAYMQNYLQNVSSDFYLSDTFDKGDMYLLVRPRDAAKNFAHSDDFADYLGRFHNGLQQYYAEKAREKVKPSETTKPSETSKSSEDGNK